MGIAAHDGGPSNCLEYRSTEGDSLSPLLVEKSKLTQLLGVIKSALHQEGLSYQESFEVELTGAKNIAADSLQHILETGDVRRRPIPDAGADGSRGCSNAPKPDP